LLHHWLLNSVTGFLINVVTPPFCLPAGSGTSAQVSGRSLGPRSCPFAPGRDARQGHNALVESAIWQPDHRNSKMGSAGFSTAPWPGEPSPVTEAPARLLRDRACPMSKARGAVFRLYPSGRFDQPGSGSTGGELELSPPPQARFRPPGAAPAQGPGPRPGDRSFAGRGLSHLFRSPRLLAAEGTALNRPGRGDPRRGRLRPAGCAAPEPRPASARPRPGPGHPGCTPLAPSIGLPPGRKGPFDTTGPGCAGPARYRWA